MSHTFSHFSETLKILFFSLTTMHLQCQNLLILSHLAESFDVPAGWWSYDWQYLSSYFHYFTRKIPEKELRTMPGRFGDFYQLVKYGPAISGNLEQTIKTVTGKYIWNSKKTSVCGNAAIIQVHRFIDLYKPKVLVWHFNESARRRSRSVHLPQKVKDTM